MPIATICLDCNTLFTVAPDARAYGRCPACRPAYLKRRNHRTKPRAAHRDTATRRDAQRFYDSPAWRKTRKTILQRDGACTRCGATTNLTVHHIQSRKKAPHLELDHDNLTTMCRSCHGSTENAERTR